MARHRFTQQFLAHGLIGLGGCCEGAMVDVAKDAKRRRLGTLLADRSVSCRLARTVMALEGGAPCSEREVRDVMVEGTSSFLTTIEVPMNTGGPVHVQVALPQDLLPHVISECSGFRDIFRRALLTNPCSHAAPWRTLVYADEITPGNLLRPDNGRKIMAIYMSWLELGKFLRLEESWLMVAVVRTRLLKEIDGRFSCFLKQLLRKIFLGPRSLNTAGIVLELDGPRLFWAKYHLFIGDERACKEAWGIKGASGVMPCMNCKNVCSLQHDQLVGFDRTSYLVDVSCCEHSRLDTCTDAEIFEKYDNLARMKATGTPLAHIRKTEMASGVLLEPQGLLAAVDLREVTKPSRTVRDPMHVILASGVMNTELFLLLQAWRHVKPRFRYATLELFCGAAWRFPSSTKYRNMGKLFCASRETASLAARTFKAGASELLSVYPLVRYFVEVVIAPSALLLKERASFLALCEVIDIVQTAKFTSATHQLSARMKAAVARSLQLHVDAYGKEFVRPKHHFLMHIWEQPAEDTVLLDSFVHERKHQAVKAKASLIRTTQNYERSVLQSALYVMLGQMDRVSVNSLLGRTSESLELSQEIGARCVVSLRLQFQFVTYMAGDVLFSGDSCYWVDACAQTGDEYFLICKKLRLRRRASTSTSTWSLDGGRCAVQPPCRHASAWFFEDSSTLTLLA